MYGTLAPESAVLSCAASVVVVLVGVLAARVATRTREVARVATSSDAAPTASSGLLGELEISGCAAMTIDGVCGLREDAILRAWLLNAPARVAFDLDGAALEPTSAVAVQDGTRFELRVPVGSRSLRASVDGAPVASRAFARAAALPGVVAEAKTLRAKGDLAAADGHLARERERLGNAVDPAITGTLARIALARGDATRVDALFAESIDANERAGLASSAVEDAAALLYSLFERARFAEAERVLTRATELARRYPDGAARLALYDARLASSMGDRRRALFGFRATAEREERLGLHRDRRMALQEAAMELDAIGRVADAVDELVALHASDGRAMDACDRVDLEANVGWIALHLPASGRVDPRVWLRRAITSLRDDCAASHDPSRFASFLGDLARAELDRGALDDAAARLREAEATIVHPPPAIDLQWRATRADLALARGKVDVALVELDGMRTTAEALGDRESLRAALAGRAEALARKGDRVGALDALARAAAIVDATIVAIPLGEGREAFARAKRMTRAAWSSCSHLGGRTRRSASYDARARASSTRSPAPIGSHRSTPRRARGGKTRSARTGAIAKRSIRTSQTTGATRRRRLPTGGQGA